MGLKRDVINLIYYMSNGLTFEILNIILRNFQGYQDSVEIFFKDKSKKNMRHWLVVAQGIVVFCFYAIESDRVKQPNSFDLSVKFTVVFT